MPLPVEYAPDVQLEQALEEGAPVPELKDPGWQAAHALDATEPVPVP